MTHLCGHFQPAFECDSLLQLRDLILRGSCLGILPSIRLHGLAEQEVISREFTPMKDYGRPLALHWNDRQMRRRGIEPAEIQQLAKALT